MESTKQELLRSVRWARKYDGQDHHPKVYLKADSFWKTLFEKEVGDAEWAQNVIANLSKRGRKGTQGDLKWTQSGSKVC
jgi:hypothetical protein